MKGLILSAGLGSRFRQYTQNQHKLLLTVNGVPVIDYALQAFFRAGIYDVGLVTGFMADHISDWVGNGSRYGLKIKYIFNADYKLGNAISLQVAQAFTGDEDFVLSMGDHMVSHSLITQVLEFNGDCQGNVLGVDFGLNIRHAHDATRVLVEAGGRISSIGKHLNQWNGIDAGTFVFSSQIYGAVNQWITRDESGRYELGGALAYLIDQGGSLQSCDISGHFWHDVDDMKDLNGLQRMGFDPVTSQESRKNW
jgi:choline kinase